ncbi:MAG: tetratricopeptide repeat protein [Ignavibacteria bacterium]|nr:tetratricopeptide repeat protein [Ignavibacteria bacterium]
MKKYRIFFIIIVLILSVFLFIELNRSTKLPDHIHSIDDKSVDQRTDEENITVLERTLQKEPNNVNVMIQLADLYTKTDQKRDAKRMIENILEIDPSNKEGLIRLERIK